MKSKGQGIEAITVPRKKLAEAEKVRYRVYSTPTEFTAVIAESALMAVKVSGIAKPHKIVRDLPTEGIAVESRKMTQVDTVVLNTNAATPVKKLVARIDDVVESKVDFKPMNIGDLQHKGVHRARILSPEMVSEIIEQHARVAMAGADAPKPAPAEVKPEAPVPAAPVTEEVAPSPATTNQPAVAEPVPEPEPQDSIEDRITQMAGEILPSAEEVRAGPQEEPNLSPEEVEKLLNG